MQNLKSLQYSGTLNSRLFPLLEQMLEAGRHFKMSFSQTYKRRITTIASHLLMNKMVGWGGSRNELFLKNYFQKFEFNIGGWLLDNTSSILMLLNSKGFRKHFNFIISYYIIILQSLSDGSDLPVPFFRKSFSAPQSHTQPEVILVIFCPTTMQIEFWLSFFAIAQSQLEIKIRCPFTAFCKTRHVAISFYIGRNQLEV